MATMPNMADEFLKTRDELAAVRKQRDALLAACTEAEIRLSFLLASPNFAAYKPPITKSLRSLRSAIAACEPRKENE